MTVKLSENCSRCLRFLASVYDGRESAFISIGIDYSHGRRSIKPEGVPLCGDCLGAYRTFWEKFMPHDLKPFIVAIKYNKNAED